MSKIIKCLHCNRVFFDIGNDSCPFCKKNPRKCDLYKQMFGKNNSFIEGEE